MFPSLFSEQICSCYLVPPPNFRESVVVLNSTGLLVLMLQRLALLVLNGATEEHELTCSTGGEAKGQGS